MGVISVLFCSFNFIVSLIKNRFILKRKYNSGVTGVEINSSIQETSQVLWHLNQIEKTDSNVFRLPGTLWRPQIPFGLFSQRELSGPCSIANGVAAST